MSLTSDLKPDAKNFFHAYVRRAMIGWCAQGIANEDVRFVPSIPDEFPLMSPDAKSRLIEAMVEHARSKGWVSKNDHRILTSGYKTAKGMMKLV